MVLSACPELRVRHCALSVVRNQLALVELLFELADLTIMSVLGEDRRAEKSKEEK